MAGDGRPASRRTRPGTRTRAPPTSSIPGRPQSSFSSFSGSVRFNGTVSPEGPSRYTIEGQLDAYCSHGTATRQSAIFGYRNWNGTWHYQSFWCDETPVRISVRGDRHEGGSVEMVVGATSAAFNLYNYGNVEFYRIGE